MNNRKLVFYGAISLDGYLARENHSLDWLFGTEGEEEIGYLDFYETVDTILMGRKTYEEILKSNNGFLYEGKECYVFSRSQRGRDEHVEFINDDIVNFTQSLKKRKGKRIWIVGGGEVLLPLIQAREVDEFIIQITPILLGSGIPLFIPGEQENKLRLMNARQCKQFAELYYELKESQGG